MNGRPPVQMQNARRGTPQTVPPKSPVPIVVPLLPVNGVQKMGVSVLMVFVFLRFSLLHELLASKLHFDTYLLLISGALLVIFTFISGGIGRAIRHRAGPYWMAFSFLLIVATVFSTWRGGSMGIMSNFFKTNLPGYLGIAGLICTWQECRKLLKVLAGAGVVFIMIAAIFGDSSSGRLEIPLVASVGNSNDLSAHLLFIIPFMIAVALSTDVPKLMRFSLVAFTFMGLSQILGTASRGAMVAVVAVTVYVLIRGSGRQRFAFSVLIVLAGGALFVMLSSHSANRLATLFADDSEATTNEAVGSKATRQYLLQKSIEYTMQHPFLGVGPGEFGDIEGFAARAAGYRGAWQVTHNAYTEISSEAGIPALICILGALVVTARSLRKALLQARLCGDKEVESTIFCVSTGMVGLCVAIFFLAMGFRVYLPAVTGIGVVVAATAQKELARRTAEKAQLSAEAAYRRPLAV
jgi:O-antigen ligase